MRKQNNDEKGYFFRAGQCAALSSFRVGKNATFVGNVYVNFTSLLKRCNKGCLVVTGLGKKLQYYSYVYCISVIYKGCRSIG